MPAIRAGLIELLYEIAAAHPMILKNPAPNVGFTAFQTSE